MIPMIASPIGVDASTSRNGSVRDRSRTPRLPRSRITSIAILSEPANRSSARTTSTSPSRRYSIHASHAGRCSSRELTPRSTNTRCAPAARSSASCASVACSRVDTRAYPTIATPTSCDPNLITAHPNVCTRHTASAYTAVPTAHPHAEHARDRVVSPPPETPPT